MNSKTKWCAMLLGLVLLFAKLFLDVYGGAENSLAPNLGNDAINWAWPFYSFAHESVKSVTFPLWNPYSSLGSTFVADITLGMLYPITWIVFLVKVPVALLIIQFVTVLIGCLSGTAG